MSFDPLSKSAAEELFNDNPISADGLAGETLPLVFSTLAMVDQAGAITVRLQAQ